MATVRHRTNPFLEGMTVPVKGQQIKLSKLGKDSNVLVNQATGEVQGTHVTTYKKVDNEQFVKLFTSNIGLTFNLTSSGIKAFSVLLWTMQNKAISKDVVPLDIFTLEDFLSAEENLNSKFKLSPTTYRRGIKELERSQIIAKTIRQGQYFINPNFVFNGDRIAFTTVVERKGSRRNEQEVNIGRCKDTLEMFSE